MDIGVIVVFASVLCIIVVWVVTGISERRLDKKEQRAEKTERRRSEPVSPEEIDMLLGKPPEE